MTIPVWLFTSGVSQDLSHRADAGNLSPIINDYIPPKF